MRGLFSGPALAQQPTMGGHCVVGPGPRYHAGARRMDVHTSPP